jgi:cytochrome P450
MADSSIEKSHATVFHEIMYSSDLPPSEKSPERILCEAIQFITAGMDTVANTLYVMTFHMLDNPSILLRLREELRAVQPNADNPANLRRLEQLPYLTSVILEGLRLGYGVSTRSARVAPDRVIKYKDWEIPSGTAVGMTSVLLHHYEEKFPEPEKFNPERWVDLAERQRLDKYMVAFSKGTRQCLGIKYENLSLVAPTFRSN